MSHPIEEAFAQAGRHVDKILTGLGMVVAGALALRAIAASLAPSSEVRRVASRGVVDVLRRSAARQEAAVRSSRPQPVPPVEDEGAAAGA